MECDVTIRFRVKIKRKDSNILADVLEDGVESLVESEGGKVIGPVSAEVWGVS